VLDWLCLALPHNELPSLLTDKNYYHDDKIVAEISSKPTTESDKAVQTASSSPQKDSQKDSGLQKDSGPQKQPKGAGAKKAQDSGADAMKRYLLQLGDADSDEEVSSAWHCNGITIYVIVN
jgi:hypothetical protein